MIDGEGRREGVEGEEKVGGMEEGKDSDDRKTGKNEKTKKQTHNDGRASEEKLIFLSKKTNQKEIIENIFFFVFLTKGRSYETVFFSKFRANYNVNKKERQNDRYSKERNRKKNEREVIVMLTIKEK